MEKKKELNVAIIGAGWAGMMAADAYESVHEANIAVIIDTAEGAGITLAKKHKCEWSNDYEEVLDRPNIDMVDVCTPPFLHTEHSVKAAEAGKHVCCQKPLALSLKDCDEIMNAANKNKVKLIVQEMTRFGEPFVRTREMIDKGMLGIPEITYWNQVITAKFAAERPQIMNRKKSGAMLIDYNVHAYDLLSWYHGEVSEVYAAVSRMHPILKNLGPDEDHGVVTLRFKDDSMGIVEGSYSSTMNTPIWRIQTIGTKGTVEVEQNPFSLPFSYKYRFTEIEGPTQEWFTTKHGFSERAAYFVKCILKDGPIERSTAAQAKKAVEIGLAAIESTERNAPVKLPPKKVRL